MIKFVCDTRSSKKKVVKLLLVVNWNSSNQVSCSMLWWPCMFEQVSSSLCSFNVLYNIDQIRLVVQHQPNLACGARSTRPGVLYNINQIWHVIQHRLNSVCGATWIEIGLLVTSNQRPPLSTATHRAELYVGGQHWLFHNQLDLSEQKNC